MSKKNLSLTPFARLLIVLLFAAPLAYIGASYYNGEDGIQNIKELFGIAEKDAHQESTPSEDQPSTNDQLDLEEENERLRKEIEELKKKEASEE